MKEFIKDYPIFSYVATPILFVLLIVLIIYVLKKRHNVKDECSKLYLSVLNAADYVTANINKSSKDMLKPLLKKLEQIRFYYEMLESEELYEVEDIIINLEKAESITRALIASKANSESIQAYLPEVEKQLFEMRKIVHVFGLAVDDGEIHSFTAFDSLNIKTSKKKAEQYLKGIKR